MGCTIIMFLCVHVLVLQLFVMHVISQGGDYTVANVSCVITHKSWIEPDRLLVTWARTEVVNVSDVTVQWFSDQNTGECSKKTLTSCMCRYGDPNCMDFHSYFEIHMTSQGHMSRFTFDADNCRKPPKLGRVAVQTINSTCLNVKWHYDVTQATFCSENELRVYQLLYRADADTTWEHISLESTRSCSSVYVLCGLAPFTRYHVAVQCRFTNHAGRATGHWSELTQHSATTRQSVPTDAPRLAPGVYTHVTRECRSDVRTVTLYWQPVPLSERHGVITAYHVTVYRVLPRAQAVLRREEVGGAASSLTLRLHCSPDYRVTLAAATQAGLASAVSSIDIPHITPDAGLDVVDVIPLVTGTRNLSVMWNLGEARTDTGTSVVVIWCPKSSASTAMCKSAADWRVVPAGSGQLTVSPPGGLPLHQYQVGVSAGRLGITWTTCQFAAQPVPLRPVGVAISPAVSRGALTVRWENSPCEARTFGPYIYHFLVETCVVYTRNDTNCSGPIISAKVDHDEASYVLYDLEPDSLYKVNVIAVGRDAVRSPPSNDVFATLPAITDALNTDWIPILASLGAAGVIALITFIIVRNLRRRAREQERVESVMLYEPVSDKLTTHAANGRADSTNVQV